MKNVGLVPSLVVSMIAVAVLCTIAVQGGWMIWLPILATFAITAAQHRSSSR